MALDSKSIAKTNHALATAFLKILRNSIVTWSSTAKLTKLIGEAADEGERLCTHNMRRNRKQAGDMFDELGRHPKDQTDPVAAAAYATYLLCGVFDDPNQRPAAYGLVESMQWLRYAGVSTESMSGIVNLLLT